MALAPKVIALFIALLVCVCATHGQYLKVQKRETLETLSLSKTEGDVECFTDYMELWVHRMKIEGLRVWLSGVLRIPVSLVSLEDLNRRLSACGFSLYRDPDRNYIFRVLYSGCFVQLQHGNYVISLHMTKRTSRYGGQTSSFVMKCPLVTAPPSGEHIQCDPDFIQVTRKIPTDNWNKELPWSLALNGKLVVALEDASLIRLSVEMDGANITVQGRRAEILSPEEVLDRPGGFLPLRLVSGQYSYSMEASCPSVPASPAAITVLYIYKRRMGLVKRGGSGGDLLSLSGISIRQTDTFSVSESGDYMQIMVNTSLILRTKSCMNPAGEQLIQPFFRVDAVLTFRETPHRLHWSLENIFPCTESPALFRTVKETPVTLGNPGGTAAPSAVHITAYSVDSASQLPSTAAAWLSPSAGIQRATSAGLSGTSSLVTMSALVGKESPTNITLDDIGANPSGDTHGTHVLETSTKGVQITTPKHEFKLFLSLGSPISGHRVMTTGFPQAVLREQSPHKDSGVEISRATDTGLSSSIPPPSDPDEGDRWLSGNTSMVGQGKHNILLSEPQPMIARASTSLPTATSGVDHNTKVNIFQNTNSIRASSRPPSLSPKAVTPDANSPGLLVSIPSSDVQEMLEASRSLRLTSHAHKQGTRMLGRSTQDVLVTIPKSNSPVSAEESPLISGHPKIINGDPLANSTNSTTGSHTLGSEVKDNSTETFSEMLLVVETNSSFQTSTPSVYEEGASILRNTSVVGQTGHGIPSSEPQSMFVRDSGSHPTASPGVDRSTKEDFLQKTDNIIGNLKDPGVMTASPTLPSISTSWLSQMMAQSTNSASLSETSPSLNGSLDVQEPLGSLKTAILEDTPEPELHRTPIPAESKGVYPHIAPGTILKSKSWSGPLQPTRVASLTYPVHVVVTSVTLGDRSEVTDTHNVTFAELSWEPVMNKSMEGVGTHSRTPNERERTENKAVFPKTSKYVSP